MALSGRSTDTGLEIYRYDAFDHLTNYNSGSEETRYTCNANNLRQSKTVNGITTQHIYNGMNVVQEKENGNLKATYHRAGNQIIYSEVNGNKNFYIYNAQGNVSKLLNTDYETVADYTFDAFGVQRAVNGDVYNPFRHNGEYYDDELGYTYLRNRYYDNASGRFITEDPIKDGTNWYSYCGGNPVTRIDPLGLKYYNAHNDTEDDIKQGMENDPVAIIESEDCIEIRVNISFSGDYMNMIGGRSFRDVAIEGIKERWEGMYEFKKVKVNIIDVTDKEGNSYVKMVMHDNLSGISQANWIQADLYAGDARTSYKYTYDEFKITAAHEFGHVLRIGDAYHDFDNRFPSIMCNPLHLNTFKYWKAFARASNLEYHLLMLVQDANSDM